MPSFRRPPFKHQKTKALYVLSFFVGKDVRVRRCIRRNPLNRIDKRRILFVVACVARFSTAALFARFVFIFSDEIY
jgi:hypothetical protein